ncbi:MAG: hypothetical protein HQL66_01265 [Magnetococcales bacterium]|nr:hypothetical protein [Magnetococcales bacterium]
MEEGKNAILVKFLKDFEARFAVLQEEVDKQRERLDAFGAPENMEEAQKRVEQLAKLQETVLAMREEQEKVRQQLAKVEKRLDSVKSEGHFGTVITIVVFSFLFILSMFMR